MKIRCISRCLLVLAFGAWSGVAAAQAGTGTIAGVVLDSAGRAPLLDVQVTLQVGAGTRNARTIGGRTNPTGHYVIAGVPAGTFTVQARLLGYQPAQRSVTVADGQTVNLDFTLVQQTTVLNQIVTTGTPGEAQRRAIGNVVQTINSADISAVAPVPTVSQLIGDRTPGVIMLPPSGQVGTGSQSACAA